MPIRKRETPQPEKPALRVLLEEQWQSRKIGYACNLCVWANEPDGLVAKKGREIAFKRISHVRRR